MLGTKKEKFASSFCPRTPRRGKRRHIEEIQLVLVKAGFFSEGVRRSSTMIIWCFARTATSHHDDSSPLLHNTHMNFISLSQHHHSKEGRHGAVLCATTSGHLMVLENSH
jgi:hypothetical protein